MYFGRALMTYCWSTSERGNRAQRRRLGAGSMSLSLRFLSRLLAYLTLASHALMAHDPHDPMTVVAVSPNFTSDQTLLVATGEITVKLDLYVLLQSTDGGTEWSVCSIPTNQPMSAIVFSPAYSSDGT